MIHALCETELQETELQETELQETELQETELREAIEQWVSVHCQGMRFTGDNLEMKTVTSGAELAPVLVSHAAHTAVTPCFPPDNNELSDVKSSWINKVRDRIRVEASLCREFSSKRLGENAKRIYAARAAALEFAFNLLSDTNNPMGYIDSPVPDHHVHSVERGIRSRRNETANFSELPPEPQADSAACYHGAVACCSPPPTNIESQFEIQETPQVQKS
jgi:hypothetical protein